MEQAMVYSFLNDNFKKFPKEKLKLIEQKLYMLPDEKYPVLCAMKFIKPRTVILSSVFFNFLSFLNISMLAFLS